MATTGELRAIIEELELVDIGDAASYLGEEEMLMEDASGSTLTTAGDDTDNTVDQVLYVCIA